MKPLPLIRLLTIALAVAALGPTAAVAESGDLITVMPADLEWRTPGGYRPVRKLL